MPREIVVHIPQGIVGWTLFVIGLAIVAWRVHGIDNPRAWAEAIEHLFVDTRRLRFVGAILALAALALAYLTIAQQGVLFTMYIACLAILFLFGLMLAVSPNHAHHLVLASAEADDKKLRLASILIVLVGLAIALAPWFF